MHESPRFFGRSIGKSAQEVYDRWVELGLIEEYRPSHNVVGWQITEYGKSLGGRLSRQGTPTFDYEDIKDIM